MDIATVIPAYNPPSSYFAAMLASVDRQTVQPAELVIVDDGSTPPVEAAGRKVIRQSNAGTTAARNRGVAATTAPLVHVLDQDELLEPTFYERLLPHFADPEVGVVFATMRGRVEDEPADWMLPPHEVPTDTAELLRFNRVGSSAAIFRRSLFDRLGGFADYRIVHDWQFWIRASLVSRVVHVPEPLAWHRRHGTQVTGSTPEDAAWRDEIAMLTGLELPAEYAKVRREAVAHRWLRIAEQERGVARRKAALRALPVHPKSAASLLVR